MRLFERGSAAAARTPTADDLQRRYLTPVLNYVTARLGAGGDAEDVTAEVFAAAFTSLHRCPPPGESGGDDPARAYLFGIARRKLANAYRRRSRRPEEPLPPDMPAPGDESPESELIAAEAARTLRAILADLPELQAEALRLKYIEDLSLAEIGMVLGKSSGAVAQLLHRARDGARRARGADFFDTGLGAGETHNEF